MEEKLNSLTYPEDCHKTSMFCKNALMLLEELDIEENQQDINWWLEEYGYLYRLLSNQPPGLPAIPRTTCNHTHYPTLTEFWRKYDLLRFPEKYSYDDLEEDTDAGCEGNDESSHLH